VKRHLSCISDQVKEPVFGTLYLDKISLIKWAGGPARIERPCLLRMGIRKDIRVTMGTGILVELSVLSRIQ